MSLTMIYNQLHKNPTVNDCDKQGSEKPGFF